MYAANEAHYVFKSSITGKPIERASIAELRQFLAAEYPDLDVDEALAEAREQVDRFQVYQSLLLPLENVRQNLDVPPRGRRALPQPAGVRPGRETSCRTTRSSCWRRCCTTWARRSTRTTTSPRAWRRSTARSPSAPAGSSSTTCSPTRLPTARSAAGPTAGFARASSTTTSCCWASCDRGGRKPGVVAPELDEALDYLRDIDTMFG